MIFTMVGLSVVFLISSNLNQCIYEFLFSKKYIKKSQHTPSKLFPYTLKIAIFAKIYNILRFKLPREILMSDKNRDHIEQEKHINF